MPDTVNACPLCQGTKSRLFDQRTFEGVPVENRLCASCGFVYQSPRMSAEENNAFYTSAYRTLYQGSDQPILKDLAIQTARAAWLVSFVKRHRRAVRRLLDIGCSAGLLMQAFNQATGCQPVGIEPGDAYRAHAAGTGFKVYSSLEELQTAGELRFDLLTLAHVLEHLPEPLAYLTHLCEQVLEEQGCLLVEVPNLFMHDSFEVAHLSAFSAHTLRQTLEQAGFRVLQLRRHGKPRSQLLPYYLTVLCQPSTSRRKRKLRPERAVRLKRRLGLFYRKIVHKLLPSLAWRELTPVGDKGEPA